MEKFYPILEKCSLFDGIESKQLSALLGCLQARVEEFDKKYTVMAEGTPAKYLGILLSGALQISRTDYGGNRSLLATVEPGELFAEAFACAEVRDLPVTVTADEPSRVMLINCRHILHTCSNSCAFHRQLILNLMKSLAEKNLRFHQRLEVTSQRSTREKLLTYLSLQAKTAGSSRFSIPLDRQELADYLEVERSGLSAEIGKLQREGVLISRKREFELL
ncbi:MAG: Crp/Fnr family transcriptional regulator [Clostridia bacterium]|nr:Crp/Fnr family transcriptional regulator [Clostridia bacterium]